MNLEALRQKLRPKVEMLGGGHTHTTLPAFCVSLGLPSPEVGGSKRERMCAAFDALSPADLPLLAETLIASSHLTGQYRNDVQDILWADEPTVEMSKRARREIATALNQVDPLFRDWDTFKNLLRDTFILPLDLGQELFGFKAQGVLEDIHHHFVRNPEDADVEGLFKDLNVEALTDARFRRFLERLVSADIQLDAATQFKFVQKLNPVLRPHGAELVEDGQDGGYPKYALVSLRATAGRPKYLVFASQSKPDIRFRSLINGDIEVKSRHGDDALVYDRFIGAEGLLWRDLQAWWTGQAPAIAERDGAISLYRRLFSCLPTRSPPQQDFFKAYYALYKREMQELPALIPEVWLHWDPKTAKQRGADALLMQRMDFLMFLPGGQRVVIEIDGKQHYADGQVASPSVYAKLAAGQRELSLAGYDVYRFGGAELRRDATTSKLNEEAMQLVRYFFAVLFERYRVPMPRTDEVSVRQ